MDRVRPFAVVGALYLAQGIVFGFAGFVLLPRLAAAGVSLQAQTGIVALAGVPWVFKLAFGPLLDRYGGRERGGARRFAIVAMLAIAGVLAWIGHASAGVPSPVELGAAWLVLNVALALQDVAADAIALDAIAPADRGRANAIMLGGHHVGAEGIGGLALGWVVATRGLPAALMAMAAAMLVLAIVAAGRTAPSSSERAANRRVVDERLPVVLRRVLADPAARRGLALAAVALAGDVATSAVSGQLWVAELRWSPQRIAADLPPILLVTSVAGYAVALAVVDRFGHRRATVLASAGLGAAWIGFALAKPAWSSDGFLIAFVAIQAIVTAVLMVGLHALLMDTVAAPIRATHWALVTALLNLPRAYAPPAAGVLAEGMGFAGLFVLCGLWQIGIAAGAALVRAQPPKSTPATSR